jgi:uncharacterized protein (DUF433 family)
MKHIPRQQRVATDPEIHHGEPCIAGTRIPVRMIVGSLADGLTVEQIVAEYQAPPGIDAMSLHTSCGGPGSARRAEFIQPGV